MPVEFKDYYKILGVPRTADADEIRKAFRTLARQYHPDVAKDKKGGEERFKEINEAYEVLGDPEKRKQYDALGSDWRGRGYQPPPRSQSGFGKQTRSSGSAEEFEFGGTGFSDFFEQFFGGRGGYSSRSAYAGSESERGQDVEADIMVTLEESQNGAIRPITLRRSSRCAACDGTGVQGRRVCATCNGEGQVSSTQRYQVKIPAGVHDGQSLRVNGQGEPGEGGGPPGDLYLRVRMASHPEFRVDGGDLYHDLDLAPWEAVLGASVAAPTLTGPVNIKIPAGTESGQRLRVRGRGLSSRDGSTGDLYVVVRIQVPKTLTEHERALWKELARESRFQPRE
jgi:curved DNA-binding protein